MSRSELRTIARESETIRIPEGQLLFSEGDEGHKAYYIRSGSIEIFSELRSHHHTLSVQNAGDFLGEMALLGSGRRGASARAAKNCVLRTLSRAGLHSLLSNHPDVALILFKRMIDQVNRSQFALIGQLTSNLEELQSLNGHLEERIRERTSDLEEANQKLRRAAVTDYLTGCYNRRHLHQRLSERCADDKPFGVVMLDIDHFKRFNDTHGHQGGDDLLQIFAKVVGSQLGSQDLLARYGGEEFTVVVEAADKARLFQVADQICRAVAALIHPGAETQPLGMLSCSGGIAFFPLEERTPEALIHLADVRLYAAKEGGRNRITYDINPDGTPAPVP